MNESLLKLPVGIERFQEIRKSEAARDNYLFQINIFVILCCSVCRLSGLL